MKLRKERNHLYGQTNIDFRSKKDAEAIKIYQPWMVKKNFGTMGNQDYHLPVDDFKNCLRPVSKIISQREVNAELPDPKYYKSAQYYDKLKIPLKQKTITTSERIAQLNEETKGKEKYVGDSMMIAENLKIKNKALATQERFMWKASQGITLLTKGLNQQGISTNMIRLKKINTQKSKHSW